MSSSGLFDIDIIFALPIMLLLLAAAGVATTVARGVALADQRMSVHELETRVRDRAGRHWATALQNYLRPDHKAIEYAEVLRAASFEGYLSAGASASTALLAATPISSPNLLQTADLLARAEATEAALKDEPVLRLVAERWHAAQLKQAASAREAASELLSQGSLVKAARQAAVAEQCLTLTAYDSYARLAQAQHRVVADNLSQVLQTMGYNLSTHRDERGTALWARSPQRTLAAVVSSSGRAKLDMTGEDLGCSAEMDQILEAMRARGIDLRAGARDFHGDQDGGTLIRGAGQRARTEGVAPQQALLDSVNESTDPSGYRPSAKIADETERRRVARSWFWAAHAHAQSARTVQ